jgi:hypothetical protein
MTTNDRTYGWADIGRSAHAINRLQALSVSLWRLAAEFEDCPPDRADIKELQDIAQDLDDYSREHAADIAQAHDRTEQQKYDETQIRNGG